MRIDEVRTKYLEFFKDKGHTVIPSSSLIPLNDPTTLFTGSGMQPLLPFLLGENHPEGERLTNSQKCFRAEDIEEVGDNRHTTFFEMLGNWSLGAYWKEEQLSWFFSFLVDELDIDPNRLYVTVFSGDPKNYLLPDEESANIWANIFKERKIDHKVIMFGTEANAYKRGMQDGRIFYYDAKKNWWSRSGPPENMPVGEPGGPDSELFYDFGIKHSSSFGEHCHPNCDCGRFMEIGNSVFMEFIKNEDGSFSELPQKNVDFGGGLERIAAAANNDSDVFNVDALLIILKKLQEFSEKSYDDEKFKKSFRIIADHMRAAILMIGDDILPSNTEQGYFVRRLIRRSVMRVRDFSSPQFFTLGVLAHVVSDVYKKEYPVLAEKVDFIYKIITEEETVFRKTLERGMKEFEKIYEMSIGGTQITKTLQPNAVFTLVTAHGFPFELVKEIAQERGVEVDEIAFEKSMREHQELSRSGAEQKFKGGLADTSEKVTMLHTATHLMLAGLRKYLGDDVHQAGSNITEARSRFDFTYPEKVDREVLDKVEEYVNEAIGKKCDVVIEEMPKEKAKAGGVEGSFWEKYPDMVNVYIVKSVDGTIYSQELCGGPHVKNTGDIEGNFKIVKEEATSAGIRRIRAVLE